MRALLLSLAFSVPLCLGAPVPALAQAPQAPEMIDRVVAVVGSTPILLSEVNERIQQARSQGMQVPEDSAGILALQRQFLQAIVDDEVIYQQARRDTSITVTDAEVQNAVDQQYRGVRNQFRTEQEFLAALQGASLGTPEEYRRFLAEQSRREAYRTRFMQREQQAGRLRAGSIGDAEMREFFNQALRSGQLDSMPPTIVFRQIVVSPKPSDSARAVAVRLADSLRTAIERGADFATLARQFSEDPGSRENGGDLGFFRRGTMVRQFEDVAFQMRPGVVSPIVRTEYGYHLIWVDRIQTGEIKARHILIRPKVTAVEQAAARRTADSVAALLRAGASMDSLRGLYGDSSEARSIGPTNRDSLPQGYAQALAGAHGGDLVGPAALPAESPEQTKWLVARVTDTQPKRMPAFEDVREQVRQRLVEQKGIQNLIADLKRRTYVDIRL